MLMGDLPSISSFKPWIAGSNRAANEQSALSMAFSSSPISCQDMGSEQSCPVMEGCESTNKKNMWWSNNAFRLFASESYNPFIFAFQLELEGNRLETLPAIKDLQQGSTVQRHSLTISTIHSMHPIGSQFQFSFHNWCNAGRCGQMASTSQAKWCPKLQVLNVS